MERGTTPNQRIVFAQLDELSTAAHESGLQSPTLIIIGDVVALSPGWKKWTETGVAVQFGQEGCVGSALPDLKSMKQRLTSINPEVAADREHC